MSEVEVPPAGELVLTEEQRALVDACMAERKTQFPEEDDARARAQCVRVISQMGAGIGDAKDQGSMERCVESAMLDGMSREEAQAECEKYITVMDAKPYVGKKAGDAWEPVK